MASTWTACTNKTALVDALTNAHLPDSMNSSSKESKAKSGKKEGNLPEGGHEGAVAPEVVTQEVALPGRQSVGADASRSGSSLPHDNAPQAQHMFGDNIAITGGQFTQAETVIQNIINNQSEAFKLLQKHVATSAFRNSAQRVDPPRCHPDTRVAILQRIYDWIIQSNDREKWLLWLNGAAGAGKSAIIQSIAERCAQAAIAIASFFFFRTDSTRNAIAPLVSTLAYQLIQVIPETSEDILLTVERNPLIFNQAFELQLQQLLIQPLLRLPRHLQRLFLVFIDGLDECNDREHQSILIKALGNASRTRSSPIVFLVASRREPQIEGAFIHRHISDIVLTLPLDNSDIEQTSDDIRHFLTDKFSDIKETHLHKHLLSTDWPPESAVEEIIATSSGQFIYASVVINYISSPRANPARQLDIIRGLRLRDASSQNPFVYLDALYQHIFSQVEALDKVLDILAYVFITEHRGIHHLEQMFLLEDGELEVYFADLTAVIECKNLDAKLKFLHASLPDFLRDKSRSDHYHIDVDEHRPKLLCMLLDRVPPVPADTPYIFMGQEINRLLLTIIVLLKSQIKASDQLQRSFINFDFVFYIIDNHFYPWATRITEILAFLILLKFNDQDQAYYHVLRVFAGRSLGWRRTGGHSTPMMAG